jgi:hypothetical protein
MALLKRTSARQEPPYGGSASSTSENRSGTDSISRSAVVLRWSGSRDGAQQGAKWSVSRSASNPVDPNILPDGRDDPDGRQKNRRVEVLLEQ